MLLVLLFSGVAGSWNGVLQRVLMTVLLLWIAISQRAADPTLPHPATRARALIPTPVDGRLEVVDFEGHVCADRATLLTIGDRSRRGCRLAIFAGSLPVHSQPPTTRSARTASLGLPGEADHHACVRCQ